MSPSGIVAVRIPLGSQLRSLLLESMDSHTGISCLGHRLIVFQLRRTEEGGKEVFDRVYGHGLFVESTTRQSSECSIDSLASRFTIPQDFTNCEPIPLD